MLGSVLDPSLKWSIKKWLWRKLASIYLYLYFCSLPMRKSGRGNVSQNLMIFKTCASLSCLVLSSFVLLSLCLCVYLSTRHWDCVLVRGRGRARVSGTPSEKRPPAIDPPSHKVPAGKIKKVENRKMGLKELSRHRKSLDLAPVPFCIGKIYTHKIRRNILK